MKTLNKQTLTTLSKDTVVCVDLDGTLIRSDVLTESLILLLKKNILYLFLLPFWLMCGFGYFKRQLGLRVQPDPAYLSYNKPLLAELTKLHEQGYLLVLATAAGINLARNISHYLGIFTDVIATSNGPNLAGSAKLAEILRRYPGRKLVYAGDSWVDLPVWHGVKAAIYVGRSKALKRYIETKTPVIYHSEPPKATFKSFFQLLHLSNWPKNALVFVPLIATYQVGHSALLFRSVIAFFACFFVSTAGCVLDNVVNLEEYKKHLSLKKQNMLALGNFSIKKTILLIPLLLLAGWFCALFLEPSLTTWVLAVYTLLTILYAFVLHESLFADVVTLGLLYLLLVFVGCAAIGVPLTPWLLAFVFFLFLGFSAMQRVSKLQEEDNGHYDDVINHRLSDMTSITILGVSASMISVLVLVMYLVDPVSHLAYQSSQLLWPACPLLFYWLGRAWMLTSRGSMQNGLAAFAFRDVVSYWVGLLLLALWWVAK